MKTNIYGCSAHVGAWITLRAHKWKSYHNNLLSLSLACQISLLFRGCLGTVSSSDCLRWGQSTLLKVNFVSIKKSLKSVGIQLTWQKLFFHSTKRASESVYYFLSNSRDSERIDQFMNTDVPEPRVIISLWLWPLEAYCKNMDKINSLRLKSRTVHTNTSIELGAYMEMCTKSFPLD